MHSILLSVTQKTIRMRDQPTTTRILHVVVCIRIVRDLTGFYAQRETVLICIRLCGAAAHRVVIDDHHRGCHTSPQAAHMVRSLPLLRRTRKTYIVRAGTAAIACVLRARLCQPHFTRDACDALDADANTFFFIPSGQN